MIKKLRRKYMLITMSLVCILLYGMLALFYIRTSHSLKQESLDALKAYSDQNPAVLFDNRFGRFFGNQDKYAHYDIFVIEYREAGNILTPYGFGEITEEQKAYIFDLMNDVLSRKDDTGVTSNYNLRYMKTYQQGMIKVVFLDKSYEDSTLSSQLFTIITVAVTGTVLLFLITLALTRIAIRPVERSWLQQQQLVADVSHELKTPLAVISSNTDIVMSHSEQSVAEQKKWLGYIKSETERMSERHPRELEPLTDSINALIDSERENLERQRNTLGKLQSYGIILSDPEDEALNTGIYKNTDSEKLQ